MSYITFKKTGLTAMALYGFIKKVRSLVGALLVLALWACTSSSQRVGANAPVKLPESNICPVVETGKWQAWINRAPTVGTAEALLVIKGKPVLPTPGYEARWRLGPTDRMMPPGQRINLEFTAPDGFVTQVLTPTDVTFETPAAYDLYREVIIVCGDQILARISPVKIVE